jgi:hypothetical protein
VIDVVAVVVVAAAGSIVLYIHILKKPEALFF